MAVSLAKYVEPQLIQTVQDIYARELDLSTNIFDAEGRINIIGPSNLTPLCNDNIRGCPAGMLACKQSDQQGADLLRWAIRPQPRGTQPKTDAVEFIRTVEPAFYTRKKWHPPLAVVYFCKALFIDFAVPIFDPSKPNSWDLLSIAYGGQYILGGKPLDQKASDEWVKKYGVKSIFERIKEILGTEGDRPTIWKMLIGSRQVYWQQIVLFAHVMYALGNGMALVGEQFNKLSNGNKLIWSRDNILRVYFEAFRRLSGAQSGCIVFYDKWTDTFRLGIPCEGIDHRTCHKEEGRLFLRLRQDSSLSRLSVFDTKKDPWWVGQDWVKQNHVFAVRNDKDELLALVNLNLDENASIPSELCFETMEHLSRQMGMFLQTQGCLAYAHAQSNLSSRLAQITRSVPPNTRVLCTQVAQAISMDRGLGKPSRECLVWLIDEADHSEAQYSESKEFLTCYAISGHCGSFPREEQEQRVIADVPVYWDSIRRIVHKVILTPAELKNEYPEFRASRAFRKSFIGLRDVCHQLMVLPIVAEDDVDWKEIAGLLVVVDSLTTYITEEDHTMFSKFCHRLYEALQLVGERNRHAIEAQANKFTAEIVPPFVREQIIHCCRDYLQTASEGIRDVVGAEGVAVFLRKDFPDYSHRQDAPIVLQAAANLLGKRNGRPCIIDGTTDEELTSDMFSSVQYQPGKSCTGFAFIHKRRTLRISDLVRHRKAVNERKAVEPHWTGRWREVRKPRIRRRGVICAQLRDKHGVVFGVLRASSRVDGLRFTRFDEGALNAIAEVIAAQVEEFAYEGRLGRRGRALAAMANSVHMILRLTPWDKSYSLSLQRSILVPIVISDGLGLGRAAYCELRDGVIVSPAAIGGTNETENRRAKTLAGEAFEEIKNILPATAPYRNLWEKMSRECLDKFEDQWGVDVSNAKFSNSKLAEVLTSGQSQIILPGSCDHRVERRILKTCQGNLGEQRPFAYIPIRQAFGSTDAVQAFLYVDSPFAGNEEVTNEVVSTIWTFVSVLGGIQSALMIRERANRSIWHFSHDVGNVLAGVVSPQRPTAADKWNMLMAQFAYYRAMAVLATFDPSRRENLRVELDRKVSLYDSMKRLSKLYGAWASDQGLPKDTIAPPPKNILKIRGNEHFLDAVLGQLLDNAIKYLKLAKRKTKRRVGFYRPQVLRGGKHVRVSVWDNGPGMPTRPPEDLYKKPYRGTTQIEGSGIGLLTCKTLLDVWVPGRLDTLSYSPRKGGGTVFHVVLPLA